MNTFLTIFDYATKMDVTIRNQLTGMSTDVSDASDYDAQAMITNRLASKFNLTLEFSKEGNSRDRSLVRWMLNIVVYFLYGRAADKDIPERVVKDYDDTLRELERIESGKASASLTRVSETVATAASSSIRMGSNTTRSHNPY